MEGKKWKSILDWLPHRWLDWTRYKDNPVHSTSWVEDMSVIKHDGIYYMFAEGRGDTAHMLTSLDRINWEEKGPLDIRKSGW